MIHKFYKDKYFTEMPESQKTKMVFSYNEMIEFADSYAKFYHESTVLKLNKANVMGSPNQTLTTVTALCCGD